MLRSQHCLMMLMNLMLLMMCEFKYILLLLDLHRGGLLLLFLFVAHNEIIVGAERSTEVLVDERITC